MVKGAAHHHVETAVEIVRVVKEPAIAQDTGVVHEDIDLAEV